MSVLDELERLEKASPKGLAATSGEAWRKKMQIVFAHAPLTSASHNGVQYVSALVVYGPALLRIARAAKAYRAAWIEANDGIESGYGPVPRLADKLDAALAALEGGTK